MSPRVRRTAAIISAIGIGIAVLLLSHRPAQAQGMTRTSGPGDFHFTTNVGSFKLLGSDDQDAEGRLDFTGNGTVLISGVNKPPVTTGTLKLEYQYLPLKKYCYHGNGSFTLDGKMKSVQWFGTKLTGFFHGRGKFRLVGEFDKQLNTGWYWTTDPTKKQYWPANSVVEYLVPQYTSQISAPPKALPQPLPKPGGK